jgi:hypothetical protein
LRSVIGSIQIESLWERTPGGRFLRLRVIGADFVHVGDTTPDVGTDHHRVVSKDASPNGSSVGRTAVMYVAACRCMFIAI